MLEALPDPLKRCWTNAFNGPAEVIQQQLDACLPIYEQALIAAQYENVDWQVDNVKDFDARSSITASLRSLAKLSLAVGRYRVEHGDARGLDAWCAAWMMGRHTGQGGPNVSYLSQRGIHESMLGALTASRLRISANMLLPFVNTLAALPEAWPVAKAIKSEQRFTIEYFDALYTKRLDDALLTRCRRRQTRSPANRSW